MSDNERERLDNGKDTLSALVRADDLPGLRMAGLDQARQLFGPEAVLQIERVENITTTAMTSLGAFRARVIVRRIDDGPEWMPPLGGTDG